MSTIIAGYFDDAEQARQALTDFARRGFETEEYACHAARHPASPRVTLCVAVCAERPGIEPAAIAILGASGARIIERAEGEWRDGTWTGYDAGNASEILKPAPAPDES